MRSILVLVGLLFLSGCVVVDPGEWHGHGHHRGYSHRGYSHGGYSHGASPSHDYRGSGGGRSPYARPSPHRER